MDWIIDRNRNFNEKSLKTLKVMAKYGYCGDKANNPEIKDAIEEGLRNIDVHASLSKHIKTNLKNFLCLDEHWNFTEVAKLLIEDKITISDAAFYIILNFKVKNETGDNIFPLQFIIRAFLMLHKFSPSNAYLTSNDFEYLSSFVSAEDITEEVIAKINNSHENDTIIKWSDANIDILKNILITSGLFSGNSTQLYLTNYELSEWIDNAYQAIKSVDENKFINGIFSQIPLLPITKSLNDNWEDQLKCIDSLRGIIFDGIKDYINEKYIYDRDGSSLERLKASIGITDKCYGFYQKFRDYENIVALRLIEEPEKAFKQLGKALLIRGKSLSSQCTNSISKETTTIKRGHNVLMYGAPGTGKSYRLNSDALDNFRKENIERVTFYPTYSYAQFVGTYKPVMRRKSCHSLSADDLAILRVLQDKTLPLQDKYNKLYPSFKEHDQLTRLPIILGICANDGDILKTMKKDETPTGDDNVVEFNHGKAIQRFVQFMTDQNTEDRISYRYVPGPFIRTWLKAIQNKEQNYLLIIEELNRANAAAVFGDLFQLLDRKPDGESEYPVTTSEDLRDYLEEQLGKQVTTITIPSNLYIWTTMNSADQGVQPLDTAFKRRWDYTYMGIDSNEKEIDGKQFTVAGNTYKWNALRKEINRLLMVNKVNEDKLIGPFYLKPETLTSENFVEQFCHKILMYLFEDAARQRRDFFDKSQLGVGDNGEALPETYSNYCKAFVEHGPAIFKGIALKPISDAEDGSKDTSGETELDTAE